MACDEKAQDAQMAVLPHAGLVFSAPLTKAFFCQLDRSIDKLLILSPSHYFHLPADQLCYADFDSYQGPFGDLEGFCLGSGYERQVQSEHGVEMMLPFASRKGSLKIAAALVNQLSSASMARELAMELDRCIDSTTAVIASSDFTHYGRNFGYVPYGAFIDRSVREKVYDHDMAVAKRLAGGTMEYREDTTICGLGASCIVSELARMRGLEGRLEAMSDSLSITGLGTSSFVSYASVIWRNQDDKRG